MKKKIVSIIGTGVIGAGWAARFLAKGRFADFNGEIATFVVIHPDPGLLGAALICLEEHSGGR